MDRARAARGRRVGRTAGDVVKRQGAVSLALVATSALLACDGIIGLGQPSVRDDDASTVEGGEPGDSAPTEGAAPDGDATLDAPMDATQSDRSIADVVTSGNDSGGGPPGETGTSSDGSPATGPARVYVVNATTLEGVVICLGRSSDAMGTTTTVGAVPPYPQHTLPSGCVPLTCPELGYDCGQAGDGCGGILQCGTCMAPQVCGGGGSASRCGSPATGTGDACVPTSCATQGLECGAADDGCGTMLQCGTCAPSTECLGGHCGVPAASGGLRSGTGIEGPIMDSYANTYATAFLIPAWRVQAVMPPTCDVLIGADGRGGMLMPTEYFQAGTAPLNTFAPGTTTLVAFYGCPPGLADGSRCGMGYQADAGNLQALVSSQPTPSDLDASAMLLLAAHVAPALDCLTSGCPAASVGVGFVWPTNMAGLQTMLGAPPTPGTLHGFQQNGATAGLTVAMHTWQASFDDIARASNGGSTTTESGAPYFTVGQEYFFVLVGDPRISPDASANDAFHAVAAPLVFTPDPQP